MGVFEHFPWTNFHDLNLNWILRKLRNHEDRITKNEADIAGLTDRMDDAEADIERLDYQINGTGGLADQITNLDGRVTNLEGGVGNLLNAQMLDTFDSVVQNETEVELRLHSTRYYNGEPDRTAITRPIQGASATTAGVMTSALYNELKSDTAKLALIGDYYGEQIAAQQTLVNNTNTRVLMHNFVDGYWIVCGGVAFEVTIPGSGDTLYQIDLAASVSSDPNGPGWLGMRHMYFLKPGTYHVALPCAARAYNFNTGGGAVTSNGCLWAYYQDVSAVGATVKVLTNLTSETGNKTEIEAVRII